MLARLKMMSAKTKKQNGHRKLYYLVFIYVTLKIMKIRFLPQYYYISCTLKSKLYVPLTVSLFTFIGWKVFFFYNWRSVYYILTCKVKLIVMLLYYFICYCRISNLNSKTIATERFQSRPRGWSTRVAWLTPREHCVGWEVG